MANKSVKREATITVRGETHSPEGVGITEHYAWNAGFKRINCIHVGKLVTLTLSVTEGQEANVDKRVLEICNGLGIVGVTESVQVEDHRRTVDTKALQTVDALIGFRPEVKDGQDARQLNEARRRGYLDLEGFSMIKLLRIIVEAPTSSDAIDYVKSLDKQRPLSNPIIQTLQLR